MQTLRANHRHFIVVWVIEITIDHENKKANVNCNFFYKSCLLRDPYLRHFFLCEHVHLTSSGLKKIDKLRRTWLKLSVFWVFKNLCKSREIIYMCVRNKNCLEMYDVTRKRFLECFPIPTKSTQLQQKQQENGVICMAPHFLVKIHVYFIWHVVSYNYIILHMWKNANERRGYQLFSSREEIFNTQVFWMIFFWES